ncbi:DUF3270 family protein [Lactococcus fujiensis]|uniref:DUF3270 family protein n=1 Tax=Lactococcus fujiensis JCM 16395 TaxID=1291764 RepID=A0A2A5RN47_9LACT|nr:DUF3270 family protein [Lactococcus fujiensis]PCS00728.1 hypothetical protein RT41_GL001110 [Lactococcus fujiensis JCM 16395]
MELRNFKDFYEKQTYYDYAETQNKTSSNLDKRVSELTFFVNIALFSVLLAILTYWLVSVMTAIIAVPIAFVLSLIIFLACKKGLSEGFKMLMK